MNETKSPRPLSLVRFKVDQWMRTNGDWAKKHDFKCPFHKDDVFVYLGDIIQAPGHCVVIRVSPASKDNKPDEIFSMRHTFDFEEVLEDD